MIKPNTQWWARLWDSDLKENVIGEVIGLSERDSSNAMITLHIQLDSGKIVKLWHSEVKTMGTEEKDKYLRYKARRKARKLETEEK